MKKILIHLIVDTVCCCYRLFIILLLLQIMFLMTEYIRCKDTLVFGDN